MKSHIIIALLSFLMGCALTAAAFYQAEADAQRRRELDRIEEKLDAIERRKQRHNVDYV